DRQAALVRQHEGTVDVLFLARAPGAHELQVEAPVEARLPEPCPARGEVRVPGEQRTPDVARGPAGQRDQSLAGVTRQPLPVHDRRAAPLALEPRARHEASEVAIAVARLAQE